MTSSKPPGQWRVRGSQLYAALLLLLGLVLSGTSSALRLLEPGGSRGRHPLDAVFLILLAAGVGPTLVVTLRTRVRILPDGLEVRELRTRRYPWSEIAEVRLDRWTGARRIVVILVDGRTRLLPTPVLGRRPDSGRQVARAVAAIESRLPPDRPRIARDEPTSLDDLLHE